MILLIKVTLVFAAGWLISLLLVRKSAASRHFIWALTLTGALGLALIAPIAPVLPLRMAAWPAPIAPHARAEVPAAPVSELKASVGAPRTASVHATPGGSVRTLIERANPASVLVGLWSLGAVGLLSWYSLGRIRLARLVRRAVPVTTPEWTALLAAASVESGVTSPVRLYRTSAVGSPITWGLFRPVILLPENAESWPADRRHVVLAHELAHAARGDVATQLIACLACAVYWFHPLAWIAARRLRAESERACDDHVLVRGTPGAEYATHLLEVARRSGEMRFLGTVAIGMARRSQLEGRLLAALEPGIPRSAPAKRARLLACAGMAVLVLPLASMTPAPRKTVSNVLPAGILRSTDAGFKSQDADTVFEGSVEAKPGGQMVLDLEGGGAIAVRGWDRPMIQVHGNLRGRDWAGTRVELERTDDGARLHAWQDGGRRSYTTSHEFEIRVPLHYNVRIKSAGGEVTLVDVEGRFEGETGGGGYSIERAKGEAHLGTGGGDVRVTDSDLGGSISTGGGLVTLSRVRGGLRGSSGSGPVIYTDGKGEETGDLKDVRVSQDRAVTVVRGSAYTTVSGVTGDKRENLEREKRERLEWKERGEPGMIHISKAGGAITLESAPNGAEVSTGGGKVEVGRAKGFVSASTGGGDIVVGPVSGEVEANTGAGDVNVWITDARGSERLVTITSGSGNVVVELPADLSARFELETGYTESFGRATRIESEWELTREATTGWDRTDGQTPRKYVRASGEVGGGGPLILIRTVNGNITVRTRNP